MARMNDAVQSNDALHCIAVEFGRMRDVAERALDQLPATDFGWRPDERSNSVAILLKHLGGYLRSRFTDFLTTDGEKPTRNRPAEFRNDLVDQDPVLEAWNVGWSCVESTLRALRAEHLQRTVTVRGEPFTVLHALLWALTHTAYHVGQIVELARMRAPQWTTLTRPAKPPGSSS